MLVAAITQDLRESSAFTQREDHFRRVQKQLLVDVASARSRRKHEFILEQLRKSMVTRRIVKPAFGEVLVYEFEFQNPYSHEQVRDSTRVASTPHASVAAFGPAPFVLHAGNGAFKCPCFYLVDPHVPSPNHRRLSCALTSRPR